MLCNTKTKEFENGESLKSWGMHENLFRVKRGSEKKASIVPISYLDTTQNLYRLISIVRHWKMVSWGLPRIKAIINARLNAVDYL